MNILDVAKYFISKVDKDAGENITHLKLQKLTYYAQAWNLAIDGNRLFEGHFEAWAHGPVNPDLYQHYKVYGFNPIPLPEDFDLSRFGDEDKEFLDDIWNLYGRYDAKYLENLTHKEKPWKEARGNLPEGVYCDRVLNEKTMIDYYGRLLEDE